MIGSIAGDIIASPYRDNPLPDSGSFFFPLFSSSTRVDLDGGRGARSRSFGAMPTILTALTLAAARWRLRPDGSAGSWRDEAPELPGGVIPSGPALLAVCAPLAALSEGHDEAFDAVSTVLAASAADDTVLEGAHVLLRLLAALEGKSSPEALRAIIREAGWDPDRNPSEMRPLLSGTVVQAAPGRLGIGDGRPCRHPSQVIPAALSVLLASESYEETVRRATALAGDPCLTAVLAGALAGRRFGVPEAIASQALDFLPASDRLLVGRVERLHARGLPAAPRPGGRNAADEGKTFRVIRMDGRQSIYVIPEGADDIEAAVKAVARRTGMPYETVRPEEMEAVLGRLSRQRDAAGAVLDGTYAEHPRPEVKTLWLQEGTIRTSTTRKGTDGSGRPLPPPERRIDAFNAFNGLREYAEEVRSELERLSRADPPAGMHIHFASAFYPVVHERSIDLMQGDVLRGRVGLDGAGRIRVDTSAPTGGIHTEGLEGVLATMDLFHRNDTPADIRLALDRWCLDRGAVEDEDERRVLSEGGEEAEGVRRRYRSNIDTAIGDLRAVPGELRVAVPEGVSPGMGKALEAKAEKVGRSRERYAGIPLVQAVWSRSHPGSVFTIGHSNLAPGEFEGLLKKFGIQLVVDVRSITRSRFSPQYDAAALGRRLEDGLGIGYQQAGGVFGDRLYEGTGKGRRRLSLSETAAKPEFARYMKALRECVRDGVRVALLGSESNPSDSHRFALLGYALAHPSDGRVKPVDVQHITRSGHLLAQGYLEDRLVKELGLSGKPGSLAEAMRIKGRAIVERNRDGMAISLRRNMKDRLDGKGPSRMKGR